MALVSITRLHLRSLRYLPRFLWRVLRISRQTRRATGFLDGQLASESAHGYWTLTVWDSEASMRSFRDSGVHGLTMRDLLNWCDEASFVHWEEPRPTLPPLDEAYQRLRQFGRVSKVLHPSPTHARGQTAGTARPQPGMRLRPARR
jgi:hypothetical protein